jgi:hypothetical protein
MNMNTDYTFENWYEEFHNLFTEIDLADRKDIARAAFDRAKGRKPLDFAPIPEGAERHNPSGAVPETVGADHRLLVVGEEMPQAYQYLERDGKTWTNSSVFSGEKVPEYNRSTTIRVPSGTPYPCGSRVVDGKLVKPWVPKFKKDDKVSVKGLKGAWFIDCAVEKIKSYQVRAAQGYQAMGFYREEDIQAFPAPPPWTLTRHIPGFRPLRDGEEWLAVEHWNRETLPDGARPLFVGEAREDGDEVFCFETQGWHVWPYRTSIISLSVVDSSANPTRTRRPLPEPAPEPAKVPLGPEDVLPGSVISNETIGMAHWKYVEPTQEGMRLVSSGTDECVIGWEEAMIVGWKIHRPGNLDANGKPVFEPCWKLA